MAYIGELAALTTAVCWSFTSVFFAEAGRRIGSFRVNCIRLLMAVSIYTVILYLTTGRLFPESLNTSQTFWLSVSGIIGLVIGDGFGFKSMVMIGPRLMMLLHATAPIMATLIAWFLLGEQLGLLHLLGIALTVFGVSWVILERRLNRGNHFNLDKGHPDSGTMVKGVLLGLGSALGQASGLVLSKYAMLSLGGTVEPMPASYIRMVASLIFIWFLAGFRGEIKNNLNAFKDRRALAFVGGGAFFGPFLGVWMSLVAVRYIEAGIAATLNSLTPIFIIPVVMVMFKEKVSMRAFLGAVVAVLGVSLLLLGDALLRLF
ncbi:MAG: DMT family transporter [Candidatus Zixiibacteriota bacterium]